MEKSISVEEAAKYGIVAPLARRWVSKEDPASIAGCAQDAALLTEPNTTVPAEFLYYLDPKVIDILFAPRRAREFYKEVKKGDWTTSYMKFRQAEMTGEIASYSDYGQSGMSGVNYNWPTREQYRFQTIIQYGDLEVAMSAEAKLSLAADKQRSAANTIDMAANRFYFFGVKDREIYGLFNDPNLNPAIVATSITPPGGGAATTKWADKDTLQIYEDVLKAFGQLQTQSQSIITRDTELIMGVPPEQAVMLGKATNFNISVEDMLNKYFRKIRTVVVPELSTYNGGDTLILIASSLKDQDTGELGFGEKFRVGRVVPELSAFRQKFSATTYGAITYMPVGVVTMTGI